MKKRAAADLPISLLSRDEMNLAEFPLTVLSKRCNDSVKTLEFNDAVIGRGGETIKRTWIITGADKFGLPTSRDDEVLLGLLKLTVDTGLGTRKVYFTRYELLRTLQWTTEGRSYSRLQKAFDRLSGVRIKATNAFYDNESKKHSTKNFGIIDEYEINNQRDNVGRPSFFVWSDVLFQSFQAGFIKKFDLDFYLSLKCAAAKRLYRYLDKHFWYRSRVALNIFTLCHEKIGVSRNYTFASSLCQQIRPALDELQEVDFLKSYEFQGKGRKMQVIINSGGFRRRAPSETAVVTKATTASVEENAVPAVVHQLVARGIKESQARRLTRDLSPSLHQKCLQVVQYFDYLRASESNLILSNPTGFLFRAIEGIDTFTLPRNFLSHDSTHPLRRKERVEKEREESRELRNDQSERTRDNIKEMRARIDPGTLQKISEEVTVNLSKLRGQITEKRFNEAVEHGVNQRLLFNQF